MSDRLLSRADAAEILGVPPATLAAWAYRMEGPAFYRIGRHVRYRELELQEWIELQRVDPQERRLHLVHNVKEAAASTATPVTRPDAAGRRGRF